RILLAARRGPRGGTCVIEELTRLQALAWPDDDQRPEQMLLRAENVARSVEIVSPDGDGENAPWDVFVTARMRGDATSAPGADEPLDAIRARCGDVIEAGAFYEPLWALGYHLGPAYRWATRVHRGDGEAL